MSVRLIHHQILPLPNPRIHSHSHSHPRPRIYCISSNKSNNNNNDNHKPIKNPRRKKQSPMKTTTMSDAQLALELAVEAEKMKVRAEEREIAMRKSAEMLFDELCGYLEMRSEREEVKQRWRRMPEDERRGLVAAFVSDWGVDFQPLSRRGVMQLIDEFVGGDEIPTPNLDSVLKRLIGFVSG